MHYAIQQYNNIMDSLGFHLVLDKMSDQELEAIAMQKMKRFFDDELLKHNIDRNNKVIQDLLKVDIELNAQGLVVAAKRNRAFYESQTSKYI